MKLSILITAVILSILVIIFLKNRSENNSKANLNDSDYKVLKALKENGSDLSKPHLIDFFFDFDATEQEQVATIVNLIEKEGFNSQVNKNNDGSYTIKARKSLIPTLKSMQAITQQFKQLTKKHGGKYDGWGTEIVK
jgi:regulator of RNase E activity RraB